jgi:SAM-dependent methyltransferase
LFAKNAYDVFRCRGCGLGFVEPLPTAEELTAVYADQYYDHDERDDWGYHGQYGELEGGLKRMYRGFLERLPEGRRYRRVLDVGCAYGFFLDVVAERGDCEELLGLDVTEESKQVVEGKGHRFQQSFLEDADLPDAHFDLIFIGDAFEHLRDPRRSLEILSRVLAPDGVVLLTTVDFDAWLARWTGPRWRLMTPPEHLYFWNRASLARLFGDRGFSSEIGRYWLYYPKAYVRRQFASQFGFDAFFLALYPGDEIPLYSFDVLLGVFERKAAG